MLLLLHQLPARPLQLVQQSELCLVGLLLHRSYEMMVLQLRLVRLNLSVVLQHHSLHQDSIGPNIALTIGGTLGYPASYI